MTGVILVTGGGRGIGAATSLLAAAAGYAVCVNYASRGDTAAEVVRNITYDGGRALAVQADIASEAEVLRLYETIDGELGLLTALVNNAGVLEQQMRLDAMSEGRLARTFAVNITVRPGFIYTEMHASGGEPGRVDRLKGSIPMERGGEPAEVARAILWLLSDEASYTTGAILDVMGGK